MTFEVRKFVEHFFFFGVLGGTAYMVWRLFLPFLATLAFAAIVATICYPIYLRILRRIPGRSPTAAALISLFVVCVLVMTPLVILASFILREAISIYSQFSSSENTFFLDPIPMIEAFIQNLIPNFSIDLASIIQQAASYVVDNLVSLFAGTATTIFLFFITLIATFYFFRDGKQLTAYLVQLSPLKDMEDIQIFRRLSIAVRSVALGKLAVAIIQGVLTSIGLAFFGFSHVVLWGCVAAIGALVPSVGTLIVFVPAVAFLFYTGSYISAILLLVWGIFFVGLIDNLLGPYIMSRGNNIHPFLLLLSVLGGISLFGFIGFILGPVVLSLFIELLELFHSHMKHSEQ